MSNFIKDYQDRKEKLLGAFDQLIKDRFIPFNFGKLSFDEKAIATYKSDLLENKFYVSVCGQIKAGKSSFLNYLLFNEREVLPADPRPWTAKLTKIGSGEKEYAVVYFYSKAEWNSLLNFSLTDEGTGDEINYFEKYLQESVNKSAKNGIYSSEVIQEKTLKRKLENLKNLSAYISGEGGYTPFVSSIEIYINNPLVKDVVIVDTPGINDANELRSKVTTDFINKSSAVVYLFYANKPFGSADLDFIDHYLLAIPSSKIVFTASRCDLAQDIQSVVAYIERELKTLPELSERHFLIDGKVRPFSTLAALLKYKADNRIALTPDEQFLKKKISPELIESNGYWDELMEEISLHIMNNKGNDVLEASISKIKIICVGRIDAIHSEIKIHEQSLQDLLLNKDELNERIKRVQVVIANVNKLIHNFSERKRRLDEEVENDTKDIKIKIAQLARKDYENWLSTKKAKNALKTSAHELRYILKETIDQYFTTETADAYFEKLIQHQTEVKEKITSQTEELFHEDRWKLPFTPTIPVANYIDNAFKKLSENPYRFEGAKEDRFLFWIDSEETKANLEGIAASVIDEVLEAFISALISGIQKELDGFFGDLNNEVITRLNNYLNMLSDMQQNFADRSGNEQKVGEQLSTLREEGARLKDSWNKIQVEVGIRN